MDQFAQLSDDAALVELGARLARRRLDLDLTQQELAREAGMHVNTVARLEGGGSTQSKNLVRVLRVLGLLENLDRLVPQPSPSPLRELAAERAKRRRASPRGHERAPNEDADAWSWGDEGDDASGADR